MLDNLWKGNKCQVVGCNNEKYIDYLCEQHHPTKQLKRWTEWITKFRTQEDV